VKEKEIQSELASIRSLMERSSKFISLSGLSGILAGVYALIAAGLAYSMVYTGSAKIRTSLNLHTDPVPLYDLIAIAALTLLLSLVTGVILTTSKAKRKGQPIWGPSSRALLFHMATPLVTGGIVILVFLCRGYYDIIASTSLIFYGLSLVSASNFTFPMVKYLGLCEIILGLIAACLPGFGLLFWAIGFGVLHIVYGSIMYFKYDR